MHILVLSFNLISPYFLQLKDIFSKITYIINFILTMITGTPNTHSSLSMLLAEYGLDSFSPLLFTDVFDAFFFK